MPRSLLIAVRFHESRYHGQEDRFNGADGWPPSPGRLFQALVAGAARGARLFMEDEQALKWLERLDPPRIAAPAVRYGRAVKLFVPNNDLDSVGGDPARVSEIRVPKQWRPCFFDPHEPVHYVWDFESGAAEATRICAIAERLYQLGRGIDMAWASGQVLERNEVEALLESHSGSIRRPRGAGETATPHSGTLDSLVNRYQGKRRRLTTVGTGRKSRQLFTQPPKASFRRTGYDTPSRCLHFELRGPEGGFAPRPLASAAPLITGLRDAAAERLRKSLPEKSALFERLIIGRGAGPADLAQRIRLIPIPSIGAPHTDPSIRRIMVEIPPDCPVRLDDLEWAFAGLRSYNSRTGETWPGSLVSTSDSQMADRFGQVSHVFQSISPMALPKAQRRRIGTAGEKIAEERSQEEERAVGAVVQALRHTGLRTRPSEIHVQREPFQRRGVRAELFADGSRFSKHDLWHVQLRFREPVLGPLLIGDGRFCGLGLMAPKSDVSHDAVAFSIAVERSIATADAAPLLHAVRRALMALSRDDNGHVPRLFSGHEREGAPARSGGHEHAFLAVDDAEGNGRIDRLIVAAPWVCDRTTEGRREDRVCFEDVVTTLTHLRAGRLGVLTLGPASALADGDPLVGPSRVWETRTVYRPTRHAGRGKDLGAAVVRDVIAECERRGLPKPEGEVLKLSAGPNGGGITTRLRLRFAVAVEGPIMLGRDSHSGGGLFAATEEGICGRPC